MEMAVTTLTRGSVRLVICLHTKVDPPQAEWDNVLKLLSAQLAAAPDVERMRMLVVTGGGAPDARQRAQLAEVWAKRDIKTAILVPGRNNPLKRGLMTALTWINPAIAFFEPPQLSEALVYLGIAQELEAVWKELAGLQGQLTQVATLQLIADANGL
jgi:hypothetical protein